MKKRRKQVLSIALLVLVIGGVAGIFYIFPIGQSEEGQSKTLTSREEEVSDIEESSSDIPIKTEYTEEEKARVEAQIGVTVTEEGAMEIDVGAILSEEASVKIKREEAENLVLERLGEGAQIETAGLREYEGVKYWVVRAGKGGEVCQVWLNADNGEEFINQTE